MLEASRIRILSSSTTPYRTDVLWPGKFKGTHKEIFNIGNEVSLNDPKLATESATRGDSCLKANITSGTSESKVRTHEEIAASTSFKPISASGLTNMLHINSALPIPEKCVLNNVT